MTKVGRIVGAIIVLVGCGYALYTHIIRRIVIGFPSEEYLPLVTTLILIGLAIFGSILLILDKRIGGFLSIIVGGIIMLFAFLSLVHSIWDLRIVFFDPFLIDSIIILVGGIIGVLISAEK